MNQELLKSLFEYNPTTGEFYRIGKISRHDGKIFECKELIVGTNGCGYIRTHFDKKRHLIHRLIFTLVTGRIPEAIDHIDGNKQNNKWANLREVTHSENMMNKGIYKNSNTGELGISLVRRKYRVLVQRHGKRSYVGGILTLKDAISIRDSMIAKLGFHENHGTRQSWHE